MKSQLFKEVSENLQAQGFRVTGYEENRPWGGFFYIDEAQAQKFADTYFKGLDVDLLKISGKLSPKMLIVAPYTRLSWQYHHRRAEIWQVVKGKVAIITSPTDEAGPQVTLNEGEQVKIDCGTRHRLVGLDDWAIVAEIWQHTDADHPSDEDDIVRVQDDFGRQD
ncbi:cupin domain-containing protein [Pedobacter montanisoli]|uniref:Phosphoheptose isomerase n=1 Tax=Pedobacter montanisoli TaxID=2923277 RepID=A0ABS9ZVP4_9SPHI|nr:phosphoheptose isomerase [Pedobacter montanisoli]MCJ0742376.1 phosphoheptose isomerase [Pedobacter montanisoli]